MKIIKFACLVWALSIPLWLINIAAERIYKAIPVDLPLSSLMTFCPMAAALIMTYSERKSNGVKQLLNRITDLAKVRKGIWYVPTVLLMPSLVILSYWIMRLRDMSVPEPEIQISIIPLFILVFFVCAIGEEVGWMGYAYDLLHAKWGVLRSGIYLGVFWAIWHIVPYLQIRHDPAWIVWQCMSTVLLRVLMVWLFTHTGGSVFSSIVFHTTINVSVFMFPNFGSHYNPMLVTFLLSIITAPLIFLSKTKTTGVLI